MLCLDHNPPLVGSAVQRVWSVIDSNSFTADKAVSNAPQHGKLVVS